MVNNQLFDHYLVYLHSFIPLSGVKVFHVLVLCVMSFSSHHKSSLLNSSEAMFRLKTKKMDNLSVMISAEQNDVVSTTLQVGLHRLLPELFVHSVPLAFRWQTI